jgi:hypothetical protein
MMLEALVVLGDKFFGADDARIGKVSCTVLKAIYRVYFEIFPSFFLNCLLRVWAINSLELAHRFRADWVDLIEQNRKRSCATLRIL